VHDRASPFEAFHVLPQPAVAPSSPSGDDAQRIAGRFRLRTPLAAGASGTAWLADDTAAPPGTTQVVVKSFTPRFASWTSGGVAKLATLAAGRPEGDSLAGRADAEAASVRHLATPGLPALREVVRDPRDGVVLVYEATHGTPLDQVLLGHPDGLAADVARAAVARIAGAVAALHAVGLAHLDLRPATIVADQALAQPGLVDWGHAVALGTTQGGLPGFSPASVPYTSPSLLVGGAPAIADDVFALGCLAHELFTGLHPFSRRPATDAATSEPPVISALNPRERAVLARALAIDAAARQVAAAEIAAVFGGLPMRPARDARREGGGDAGGDAAAPPADAHAGGGWVWVALVLGLCAVAAFAAAIVRLGPG
jgi:serine/threonine protein kinase